MDQTSLHAVSEERKIYTVSEINSLVREHLETSFFDVCIVGEVSNLRSPGSGHLYFTLKDANSQLSAVLFRGQAARLRFRLEDGLKVIARGRISLYEARGTYQVQCQWMEPSGKGSLQLAFEQLKHRLAAEGLFDEIRKQPLPTLPQTIGVVTSPTGAALRDFLHVLDRRFTNVQVTVHPVRVQGAEAAPEIAAALRRMNRRGGYDVLVVCRGGGSLEDLWPFNEEIVARAVADSRIPVISAVGHEIDYTICDFVADHRAATPSAAAETVVGQKEELRDRIQSLATRAGLAVKLITQDRRERVNRLGRSRALFSTRRRLQDLYQSLDDHTSTIRENIRSRLFKCRLRLDRATEAISPRVLGVALATRGEQTKHLARRASLGIRHLLVSRQDQWRSLTSLLDSFSPLSVLDRGFALCLDPQTGRVINDTHQLPASRRVDVRLRSGQLGCEIREVTHAQDSKENS